MGLGRKCEKSLSNRPSFEGTHLLTAEEESNHLDILYSQALRLERSRHESIVVKACFLIEELTSPLSTHSKEIRL